MAVAMRKTPMERVAALEAWASGVYEDDLVEVDTDALKAIAEYASRRARAFPITVVGIGRRAGTVASCRKPTRSRSTWARGESA